MLAGTPNNHRIMYPILPCWFFKSAMQTSPCDTEIALFALKQPQCHFVRSGNSGFASFACQLRSINVRILNSSPGTYRTVKLELRELALRSPSVRRSRSVAASVTDWLNSYGNCHGSSAGPVGIAGGLRSRRGCNPDTGAHMPARIRLASSGFPA